MKNLPNYINIHDYNYLLPEDRIAKYPLESRDSSKLLYYHQGFMETRVFSELPELLASDYHLIFNDTKVIQARLLFRKKSGGVIEIFLLEPFFPSEYAQSFSANHECVWKCLVGNAKKWKNEILEKEVEAKNKLFILNAEKKDMEGSYFLIQFSWENLSCTFSDIIEQAGSTPIPPYLNRLAESSDITNYQTIYSRYEGSVAAPTAGLHFTDEILRCLKRKGISQTRLTLHVGAGTFLPVKAENAKDHVMHTEHIYLTLTSIENLFRSDKKIIAVGTTSVRALESLFHIAVKISEKNNVEHGLFLDQWEPYNTNIIMTRKEALACVLEYMKSKKLEILSISTRIMITPGYKFMMIDGIITNFHQPASTLLLLISAFVGDDWKNIYNYAMQNGYRFLSYGDSSLLIR